MRRTWPYFFVVAVVGAGAGLAIAGRPDAKDNFIIDPAMQTTTTTPTLVATRDDADGEEGSARNRSPSTHISS